MGGAALTQTLPPLLLLSSSSPILMSMRRQPPTECASLSLTGNFESGKNSTYALICDIMRKLVKSRVGSFAGSNECSAHEGRTGPWRCHWGLRCPTGKACRQSHADTLCLTHGMCDGSSIASQHVGAFAPYVGSLAVLKSSLLNSVQLQLQGRSVYWELQQHQSCRDCTSSDRSFAHTHT